MTGAAAGLATDPAVATGPALVASPDELDALAFGLAGVRFPGLGTTLLHAVADVDRARLARRLVLPLAARGVLDREGPMWTVADGYRPLLLTVLEPEVAVAVHVRRDSFSGTAIVCQRAGTVVVHEADPAGWHRIAGCEAGLPATVLDRLDAPPRAPGEGGAPVRARYSALLRDLEGSAPGREASGPFAVALLAHDYAAKLTLLGHRSGTYQAQSLAVFCAPDGPLWTAEVEPDGDDDGWLTGTPHGTAGLRATVERFCAAGTATATKEEER